MEFGGSDGEESACNVGDPGLIPGLERSPGEGNGNPLRCSCLENPMDRGAWWATVHGVAKSQTGQRETNTYWVKEILKCPLLEKQRNLLIRGLISKDCSIVKTLHLDISIYDCHHFTYLVESSKFKCYLHPSKMEISSWNTLSQLN